MKKKDITFADKANKIISKYKLRLGDNLEKNDPLAKRALERELDALKAEQDAFKQQQQANIQQQQIANQFIPGQQNQMSRGGNLPQYFFGNTDDDPPTGSYYNKSAGAYITDAEVAEEVKDGGISPVSTYIQDDNNSDNYSFPNNIDQNRFNLGINLDPNIDNWNSMPDYKKNAFLNSKLDTSKSTLLNEPLQKSGLKLYDPTLGGASPIPLIAQLAGSAAMYKGANANTINYDRVNPEEIDLSPEREDARKRADTARLMALRNARGLGLNAGEVATLGTASQESIDSDLGSTLGKSYLNEALTNAQNRQRASQINANIGMRETDSRLREKDAVTGFKQQAIQDAINGTSKYFGDVQKGRQFNADQNTKNQVYGRFEDPNQGWLSKLINPQSIVDWRSPEAREMYTQ